MNANDLLKQRLLQALANQDSANKQSNSILGAGPTDQASQFQKLPPELQNLMLQGGKQAGQSPTAGFDPYSSYMRDANQDNVNAVNQDEEDETNKTSDDDKWAKLLPFLKNNASSK